MAVRRTAGVWSLAACLLAACGGSGSESGDGEPGSGGGLGPLRDAVSVGAEDDWMHSLDSGTYWMENQGDPNNVRYFYVSSPEEHHGGRSVEVRVRVEGDPETSRAGLIYGLQQQPRRYWAVVTDGRGMIEVYTRDADGLRMTMGSSVEASGDGVTRIEIEEKEREVTIKGNGRSIGSLESPGTGSGATGILAMGPGRFGFTGFRISPEPLPAGPAAAGRQPSSGAPDPSSAARLARGSTPRPQESGQVFREHVVRDSGRNLPAHKLLVPQGWTVEGEITRAPQAVHRVPYIGDVRIEAPDGRFVRFYPFFEFGWSDQVNGQPMQPYDGRYYLRQPRTLGEFFLQMVRLDPSGKVSNPRIVSEEVQPEATETARRAAAASYRNAEQFNQRYGWQGQRYVYDRRVIRLVMSYDLEGRRLEETLFATQASNVVYLPNGSVKAANWSLDNMYSVGGPTGQDYWNDPMLAAVVRSRQTNPDWSYAIDLWYQGQRDAIVREGMAKAAAAQRAWQNTRAQESNDLLDISFNGWKSRNAASDLGQAKLVDAIHERTTYATPSGQNVQLPSFYKNVYTDGQGTFVLHNDANYQINADPALYQHDWQRIQPAY